jgi:hypothetical protein
MGMGEVIVQRAAKRPRVTGKYVLRAPGTGTHARPGWAAALERAWAGVFSETAEGRLALQLLGASLADSTNRNYDSKLRFFFEFCGTRNPVLNPVAATVFDYVEYVAWQGARGAVRMTPHNFQPYSSAVNKFF